MGGSADGCGVDVDACIGVEDCGSGGVDGCAEGGVDDCGGSAGDCGSDSGPSVDVDGCGLADDDEAACCVSDGGVSVGSVVFLVDTGDEGAGAVEGDVWVRVGWVGVVDGTGVVEGVDETLTNKSSLSLAAFSMREVGTKALRLHISKNLCKKTIFTRLSPLNSFQAF